MTRCFTLAFLFESINQITKPTAQQVSNAGSPQHPAQVSGYRPAGATRLRYLRRGTEIALRSTQQFRDLISILVARDGEKA
jgi:hypothetical protein